MATEELCRLGSPPTSKGAYSAPSTSASRAERRHDTASRSCSGASASGEDAEYHYDPFEPPLVGANDIRRYWNGIAADQSDVDFDAERVWVVGRTVLSSWHGAHSLRLSTDRVRVRGFATMEIDEAGLISRSREWPASRRDGNSGAG